jgi:hypothetical protein
MLLAGSMATRRHEVIAACGRSLTKYKVAASAERAIGKKVRYHSTVLRVHLGGRPPPPPPPPPQTLQ